MPNANELKAALERLIAGTANETDINALRNALTTGVLVTGERAVAIGGSATDAIIITGDQNIVLSLAGADVATVLTSVAPTRLHQVPPPPADFTGRADELRELLTAIERGGATISGLQGMGGIGKTTLALKLVELLKPRYPDAQLYLDLKGASSQPLSSAEALAHVIRSYHPAAKLPDSEVELRGLYLSVLEGQRALLLMDNALNAKQVEPLLPPTSCVLLVTSRWHFTLPGLASKNLEALSATDAHSFLLRIAPRINECADEIARLCGYLPQALRLAAGALAKYVSLKPADYVNRLQDRQQRLQLIDASLSLSYELLNEELRERWRRLTVFPDSFAVDAAAAVWEIERVQAQDALGELIVASMLEWNETADRYRLHDLARLFADEKLSDEERTEGHKRHATHYLDVLSAATELYKEGGEALARGLALFDLEWSNIQAGHAWVTARDAEADEDLARLGMIYADAGEILNLRLHVRERIRWLEVALATAQRWKHRKYEGAALSNLGIAYYDLGDGHRAIQYFEQRLIVARELGDRNGEGSALGNLGVTYRSLGEIQRAIQYFEQHLTIVREIGDRRGESIVLGNLGNAYADLRETKRAIELYKQQLSIVREIGYRKGEGNALGGLGVAYKERNQTQRAIRFHKQHLNIARELGHRRGEGIALWNMSHALDKLGDRAQAIQCAEQALAIFVTVEDPNITRVREQLAEWRENHGEL